MIDNVLNLVFRCGHRRLTRPMTPVNNTGDPTGETYVVCLDCGKQFAYDWKAMRIGPPVKPSAAVGVLHPDMPKPPSTKIKYALFGSAVFLVAKALWPKRRRSAQKPAADGKVVERRTNGASSSASNAASDPSLKHP